jgi:cell wall-associated NlpC family hydrolase
VAVVAVLLLVLVLVAGWETGVAQAATDRPASSAAPAPANARRRGWATAPLWQRVHHGAVRRSRRPHPRALVALGLAALVVSGCAAVVPGGGSSGVGSRGEAAGSSASSAPGATGATGTGEAAVTAPTTHPTPTAGQPHPATSLAPATSTRAVRPRGNPMAVATVVYTASVPSAHGCWNVSPAITGVKVFLVQRALHLVGHRERYDSATVAAVKAFQAAHGLRATGVVDATTWARLGTGYDFCIDRYTAQPTVPLGTLPARRIEAMIGYAAARLGVPYMWGGAGPIGYDCSGLVLQALYSAGLAPHGITTDLHIQADFRTTQALYASALPHIPYSQRRRGDLIFYGSPISHMAIELGNGQVLEAVRPAVRVAREGADGLAPQPYVVRPFPG